MYAESGASAGRRYEGAPERARAQRRVGENAHHTGDTFRPAARVPLEEVLHVDHW